MYNMTVTATPSSPISNYANNWSVKSINKIVGQDIFERVYSIQIFVVIKTHPESI